MQNYSKIYASNNIQFEKPILYLTNFYSDINHQKIIDEKSNTKKIDTKIATTFLLDVINKYKILTDQDKIILYCEPIMGDNPRSITYKNYMLTAEQRYQTLINYYKNLGLINEIETNNTLHNYLWYDDKFKITRRMRASLYGYL
jgi:hypothetical protein